MKGGGNQQNDSSKDMLYISAALVIFFGGIWFLYRPQVITVVFAIRQFELNLVLFFSDLFGFTAQSALQGINQIVSTDPQYGTFSDVVNVSEIAGSYLRYFLLVIGATFSVTLMFFFEGSLYRNTYTMDTLRNKELENWPYNSVIDKKNLTENDLDEGAFAMSVRPLDFALSHDLVDKIMKKNKPALILRKGAAHRVFAQQMGPLWISLQELPEYMKALFAIFAAKANQDGKAANKLLNQIAASAESGTPSFDGYMPLLRKHVRSKVVGRACSPHAYQYTLMASLLEAARNDGVFATAEFLWLKPMNRPLWYMLNNVGRQTAFPEISGLYAHWIVEKRLRRPLKVPQVEQAVLGLQAALDDILYKEDY